MLALCRAVFIAGFACVCWGWGNRPLCAAIAAWGLATSASRALMGRHYVSDVIAGIALGIVTTAIVTQVGWERMMQSSLLTRSKCGPVYTGCWTALLGDTRAFLGPRTIRTVPHLLSCGITSCAATAFCIMRDV